MARAYNQFATSTQFYLYGKKHFTRTGYERHAQFYEKAKEIKDVSSFVGDLIDKVFLVTGGNAGVGREMVSFLANNGATVYTMCRSRARAEAAVDSIAAAAACRVRIHILEGDVGLEADVRRCWAEFAEKVEASHGKVRCDAIVCNAGALLNEKVLTAEGVETTFASHLLFGTFLLGQLAMPTLRATAGARFIAVSSGGMYNTAFPSWEVASSTSTDPSEKYDGQFAYTYAKRGQVLLCERWAQAFPEVKCVSCHPGWVKTAAVDKAYGDSQKYLEPMRNEWQGAEGIVWLCTAPADKIESGAFYLDRRPQVKHMAGPFFTEGSHTKNSKEEVDSIMETMDAWANGRRPDLAGQAAALEECKAARVEPLKALERQLETKRFMGKWYVAANIPTPFDAGTVNNVEDYSFDEKTGVIQVDFTYCDPALTKTSCLQQRATVFNSLETEWRLSPKVGIYLPLSIPYLIVDCSEDYSTSIVGVPDRSYIWIMTRVTNPDKAVVEGLVKKAQLLGYDIGKLNYPVQEWSKGGTLIDADAEAQVPDTGMGS